MDHQPKVGHWKHPLPIRRIRSIRGFSALCLPQSTSVVAILPLRQLWQRSLFSRRRPDSYPGSASPGNHESYESNECRWSASGGKSADDPFVHEIRMFAKVDQKSKPVSGRLEVVVDLSAELVIER